MKKFVKFEFSIYGSRLSSAVMQTASQSRAPCHVVVQIINETLLDCAVIYIRYGKLRYIVSASENTKLTPMSERGPIHHRGLCQSSHPVFHEITEHIALDAAALHPAIRRSYYS